MGHTKLPKLNCKTGGIVYDTGSAYQPASLEGCGNNHRLLWNDRIADFRVEVFHRFFPNHRLETRLSGPSFWRCELDKEQCRGQVKCASPFHCTDCYESEREETGVEINGMPSPCQQIQFHGGFISHSKAMCFECCVILGCSAQGLSFEDTAHCLPWHLACRIISLVNT